MQKSILFEARLVFFSLFAICQVRDDVHFNPWLLLVLRKSVGEYASTLMSPLGPSGQGRWLVVVISSDGQKLNNVFAFHGIPYTFELIMWLPSGKEHWVRRQKPHLNVIA